MPVIDDVFTPRSTLTAAESVVEWRRINHAILQRRQEIEAAVMPIAKRLGYLVGAGMLAPAIRQQLERQMAVELRGTFDLGQYEARREIVALRARVPVAATRREDARPEAVKRRFAQVAAKATDDIEQAARKVLDQGEIYASAAAAKQAHLSVLESVGLSLNLGRTAGALAAPGGPPTYSMRSEQLDTGTCPACERYHGAIVQTDTDEYYALLPPAQCFGGGRCRGVYVFADGISDLKPVSE